MKKLFLEQIQDRYQIIGITQHRYYGSIIGLYVNLHSKEYNPIPTLCRKIFSVNVLDVLFLALQPIIGIDIKTDNMPGASEFFMWVNYSVKKQELIDFPTIEEAIVRGDQYDAYWDKRLADPIKLTIAFSDWPQLQAQWKQLVAQNTNFIVLTLDDSVIPNKIEIIGQDTLSLSDLEEIQASDEAYEKYQQAWLKYVEHHPDYNERWRSEQDDEYEADIMQYFQD